MYSWFTLLGTAGTMLAALGLAFHRFRERRPVLTRELLQVIGAAQQDAEQRGHRPLTVTHVALALLADPRVARKLEQHGVSLQALYHDVEGLLPPRAESAVTLGPSDIEPALAALFKRGWPRMVDARPVSVLQMLFDSDHDAVRLVLERHGLTAERWARPSSRTLEDASRSTSGAESGPYRAIPNANATTEVVFWNDKKTTQAFVVQVLRGTFGIVEPQATRLVLSVDQHGFAVVGAYERDEAERLARTAMRMAREAGFPLKVSTEKAGRTSAMPFLERWLRRH